MERAEDIRLNRVLQHQKLLQRQRRSDEQSESTEQQLTAAVQTTGLYAEYFSHCCVLTAVEPLCEQRLLTGWLNGADEVY